MNTAALWHDIPAGTMVDADIIRLASIGELITQAFEPRLAKQACYELRASNIFYDVASDSEEKRIEVHADQGYLLKPNCYVVCIVMEHLRLPAHVLGRILTKGRLFSIGILPVNTYADPGFTGQLGITLFNASKRYILLKPGEPIAKIEFAVLARAVEHVYTGQHGYETEIWPIASHLFADPRDPRFKSLIGDECKEMGVSYGPRIETMFRQLRCYTSAVWIQLFAIIVGFSALLAVHGKVDLVTSLSLGIVSNLLTTLGVNLWISRRR
jgi:dCTP deaminase